MLKMRPTPILATQKLIDLIDEFDEDDYGENEAKRLLCQQKDLLE